MKEIFFRSWCLGLALLGGTVCLAGNEVTKSFEATNFTGIEADGVFEVTYCCQAGTSVEVSTNENWMSKVHAEVKSGILKLWTDGNLDSKDSQTIRVKLCAPLLDHIVITGAAKFYAPLLGTKHQASLCAEVSGVGNIEIESVLAKRATFSASGASRIEVDEAHFEGLTAESSGVSNLQINNLSVDTVNAESSGMAHLTLSGRCKQVKTQCSGKAVVNCRRLKKVMCR